MSPPERSGPSPNPSTASSHAFVSSSAGGLVRAKRWYLALAALCATFTLIVIGTAIANGTGQLLMLLVQTALFGTMALRYAFTSTHGAAVADGTLRVDDEGHLFFRPTATKHGERLLAKRAELTQGFVVPTAQAVLVRLERRGMMPPLFVRVVRVAAETTASPHLRVALAELAEDTATPEDALANVLERLERQEPAR